jgi:hypothetical protein
MSDVVTKPVSIRDWSGDEFFLVHWIPCEVEGQHGPVILWGDEDDVPFRYQMNPMTNTQYLTSSIREINDPFGGYEIHESCKVHSMEDLAPGNFYPEEVSEEEFLEEGGELDD